MPNTAIPVEDQKEISKKIFYDRVRELHQHLATISLPALALCSTLVFLGLYELENKELVLAWYLSTLFICALRFGLFKWYEQDLNHPALHLKIFILGTALSGVMWGISGTILTPPHNILHKVFIIIIIAGLNAGGCQTLKASRLANSLFILTSILPLAIWTLFQGPAVYTYLSLSLFSYLIFMLSIAHKSYLQYIKSLQLHYENEFLLKKLKKINSELNEEIHEHEKAKTQLRYLASHDYLTGIDNRLSFDSQFEKTLIFSKNKHSEFCVMYIDVDYFKNINDNYGHDLGDILLIEVSKELKKNLRPQDSLARIGGDEFVILMADTHIKEIAERFCKQVQSTFQNPFLLNGHALTVSLSIGSSIFPENGETKKILLKKADLALYRAKMLGRSRYEFYEDEISMH